MTIVWDNLDEVKRFIDLVGLTKLSKDEPEWGGLGFIITGNDVRKDEKTPTAESYTMHNSDYVIVTPYYKELSWLFRNTYRYVEQDTLSGGEYLEGFWAACTGFFLLHKSYKPKTLLFFVIDFLAAIEKERKQDREDKDDEKV